MTRIDSRLYELGLASSRSQAQQLVVRGMVKLDGKTVTKPSQKVSEKQTLSVIEGKTFVSRAGFKLDHALEIFKIPVQDKYCLDIGASTGGFTDCLLQRGAKKILALDVGTAQLAESISSNAKVIDLPNQNIREFTAAQLQAIDSDFEKLSLIVCDMSFISITHALQASIKLSSDFDFIGLIKPQFEVGQHSLSASGVVTDWRERKRSIEQVIETAQDLGMTCAGIASSPIKGATGNQEYLIWLNKGGSDIPQWDGNLDALVKGS